MLLKLFSVNNWIHTMKNTRHITVFLMIAALPVSGLPHFAAEDIWIRTAASGGKMPFFR
jgi:hypothetical protein